MTEFIGRRQELGVLNEAYDGTASAFIPIYGRRRVGKSELILQLLKGRPGVYFVGKKAPAGLQIREFLEEAAAVLDEPLLASFPAESWGAVGMRDDGWTDLGECKWGAVRSAQAVARDLDEKARAYPNRRGATLGRRIFLRQETPAGTKELLGVRWHSLEDLYG